MIIDKGLDQLEEYKGHVNKTPTYILVIHQYTDTIFLGIIDLASTFCSVLDPQMKLEWFDEFMSDKVEDTKRLISSKHCQGNYASTYVDHISFVSQLRKYSKDDGSPAVPKQSGSEHTCTTSHGNETSAAGILGLG